MWNPNVQSPLIYTPRSFTWSLASIGSPLSFSCLTVGNLSSPYWRHSNLLELHFILFFDAHSYMLSKSFWKFCRSSMVLTQCPTLVSSAKLERKSVSMDLSMPKIIIRDKRGPSSEPCGTPEITSFTLELAPPTTNFCQETMYPSTQLSSYS